MSIQDNIKLDEEEIAAWNAHDVERALAIFPDNVMWHDVSSPQPFNGKDGIRQYLQGWFSAFPDMKITVKNRRGPSGSLDRFCRHEYRRTATRSGHARYSCHG